MTEIIKQTVKAECGKCKLCVYELGKKKKLSFITFFFVLHFK